MYVLSSCVVVLFYTAYWASNKYLNPLICKGNKYDRYLSNLTAWWLLQRPRGGARVPLRKDLSVQSDTDGFFIQFLPQLLHPGFQLADYFTAYRLRRPIILCSLFYSLMVQLGVSSWGGVAQGVLPLPHHHNKEASFQNKYCFIVD